MNIKVTTDTELRDTIRAKLKENGGYCPCSIIKDEDHKCMCRDFLENVKDGPCHCGLYIKEA